VPTIVFFEGVKGRTKSVEAPGGGELLDICDEHLAPVPFSCRSASCATCQIEIVEGADLLEPADAVEQELLDVLGGPTSHRLACQTRVRAGVGLVRLKPVGT
jgi:ferredoxin